MLRNLHGDSIILSYLDDLPPCVDMTDTPDLLMPLALYAALTFASWRVSVRRFQRLDL